MTEAHAKLVDQVRRGIISIERALSNLLGKDQFNADLVDEAFKSAAQSVQATPDVWEKAVKPPADAPAPPKLTELTHTTVKEAYERYKADLPQVAKPTPADLQELPTITLKEQWLQTADEAQVVEANPPLTIKQWTTLDEQVRKESQLKPKTLAEFGKITKEQWESVPQEIIESNRRRLRAAAELDSLIKAGPPGPADPCSVGLFARWTDRARKVMQLAQQEAQWWNHDYIGTEHVLVGLVKVGEGVACQALTGLEKQFTTDLILKTVRDQLQRGPGALTNPNAKLPLMPAARKVVEAANNWAARMRNNYVGTEHVLLGLSAAPDGLACRTLSQLGATPERIEAEVFRLLGIEPGLYACDAAQEPEISGKADSPLPFVLTKEDRDKLADMLTKASSAPLQVSRNTKALLFQVRGNSDLGVNYGEMKAQIESWLAAAGLGHVQVLIVMGCDVLALEGEESK